MPVNSQAPFRLANLRSETKSFSLTKRLLTTDDLQPGFGFEQREYRCAARKAAHSWNENLHGKPSARHNGCHSPDAWLWSFADRVYALAVLSVIIPPE